MYIVISTHKPNPKAVDDDDDDAPFVPASPAAADLLLAVVVCAKHALPFRRVKLLPFSGCRRSLRREITPLLRPSYGLFELVKGVSLLGFNKIWIHTT